MMRPALIAAAVTIGMTASAAAQTRCQVTDPTGTPLNVRASAPNGPIVGRLPNGVIVTIVGRMVDNLGRPWVLVAGNGWVFADYLTCN